MSLDVASSTWLAKFESLARCADSLDEVCDQVHDPRKVQAAEIPPVGRLRAVLTEAKGVANSADFRAACEALESWTTHGSVSNLRGLFAVAARALRLESRALVARRNGDELQLALLYQLARCADERPAQALSEASIRADFGIDLSAAETLVNVAQGRNLLEVREYRPGMGRLLAITPEGRNALERVLVDETTTGRSTARAKQQKFEILDAPNLLNTDLEASSGTLGACVIYLDLDHFKSLNDKYTERVIDKTVLPHLHRMIDAATNGNGFSYAEGGDEVIMLLPNATEAMGVAFANAVLERIRGTAFQVAQDTFCVRASAGLASTECFPKGELPEFANIAKAQAKRGGRDRLVVADATARRDEPDTAQEVVT